MVNTEFYSNAKIYKIVDNTNGNIYIGSTCKKLCQRIAQHRYDFKRYLNGKFSYITSFKILENGDYDIILIEEDKDCENKDQLKAKERHYIESLDCVNKRIEGRTHHEYYNDNKVVFAAKNKLYREKNKDKISEKKKIHYEENKEVISAKIICDICGGSYCISSKAAHMKCKKHLSKLEIKDN